MTARDDFKDIIIDTLWQIGPSNWHRYTWERYGKAVTDAIPGDVLVRLAIERGVLQRYIAITTDHGTPPLYQVVAP